MSFNQMNFNSTINRPQIDQNFMMSQQNPLMNQSNNFGVSQPMNSFIGGNTQAPYQDPFTSTNNQNPFANNTMLQNNSNMMMDNRLGTSGIGMGGGPLYGNQPFASSQMNQGFPNAGGYQNPFTASQSNFDTRSGLQSNFPVQPNLFNQMSSGFGPGGSNFPQLPGMQHAANPYSNFPLTFSSLSPQQQKHLSMIQTFIVKHNLTLSDILNKDLGVPLNQHSISKANLDALGRHSRAEILEQQQIDDLAMRLSDPLEMPPNNISLMKLTDILTQTGVNASNTQVIKADGNLLLKGSDQQSDELQPIRDLMTALKYTKAEQLFTGHTVAGLEGDQLVEKDIFIKQIGEEAKMSISSLNALADKIAVGGGTTKVSTKKLDQELKKKQGESLASMRPVMTIDQAKGIVDKTFQLIKRFIAMKEINIVDVFQDAEQDGGYLDRGDITESLSKIGLVTKGPEHEDRIDALYMILDPQRTKRIDLNQFLSSFYKKANERQVTDSSNRLFKVYEITRNYLKQKQFFSLGSVFLEDYYLMSNPSIAMAVKEGLEFGYDSNDFIHQLTKNFGIKELENYAFQQTFVLALRKSDTEFDKIDYQKFADFVGYEMPARSNRHEIRRTFYRTLLREMGSANNLEVSMRQQDINLQGSIHINFFINIIERYSQTLARDAQLIRAIANDFMLSGLQHEIDYPSFIQRVRAEVAKHQSITKIFKSFNEHLLFKNTIDLYGTIFAKADTTGDKKFTRDELQKVFMQQLGLAMDTSKLDVEQFFFEYDEITKAGLVKFADIERDYREYVENERKLGRFPKVTNLPTILRMIKTYQDRNGQTLRQIFGKTKLGENDNINQYQFTKIIHLIAQTSNAEIDDASIHMLMNEISTSGSANAALSKDTKGENTRHVSFSELQSLYNMTFNVRDTDAESFVPIQVDRLLNDLAKIVLANQRNNFEFKNHFVYPMSPFQNFVNDLKKEPLNCHKAHPSNILEELGKRYISGNQMVNTQLLIVDIDAKVDKAREKNQIFTELKKQILKKNQKIETVFYQALPDIQKFRIEYLSVKEFYNVFLFLESKVTTEDKLREILSTFFLPDDKGKYSYLEFINEFKANHDDDPTKARRGRRLYQSRDDVLKRIAYVIEHRGLKNFGSLLADQDIEGRHLVERDAFYRTIDSLQFALGEGDIQELIRGYSKQGMVDIVRFKDDLNLLIIGPEYKIELKSVLNTLIQERVVETIEEADPKLKVNVDPKTLAQFRIIASEAVCGLYVKETDVNTWFPKFGSFKKGCLALKEFQQAIEALDAHKVVENYDRLSQQYYDYLVARQATTIGYDEKMLLVDQLNLLIYRDCPSQSRIKMIDEILHITAIHLTDHRLPLGDILKNFDSQGTKLMYRQDFYTQFLDNYLGLSHNIKAGTGLSLNQKLLLTTKYAATQSIISFPYEQFVLDLKLKEQESKGSIKIFMTKEEVEADDYSFEAEEEVKGAPTGQRPTSAAPDIPAQSKKNTVVTEKTVTRPQLRGSIQVAAYFFEDIMMSTYRRGISVESYFRTFSRVSGSDLVLVKEDFNRALSTLGIDWSSNVAKVSEIFDAMDIAVHQGFLAKYITSADIGEAVLLNTGHTVDDILAVYITSIHKALKDKNMLPRLRDLFNFMNTNRDGTCSITDFKSAVLDKLELVKSGVVKEAQVDQLLQRYKGSSSDTRISFANFIKDMEYCDQGISPSLIWAIDLASTVMKSLLINGFQSLESFFQKYSHTQGILMYEEFRRSMDELQVSLYHTEEEQRDFFNHVQISQQVSGTSMLPTSNQGFTKVSMVQLINTMKKLCPKTPGMLTQDIFERFWTETKKNNMSLTTLQTAFAEVDLHKAGMVNFLDYKYVIQDKLRVTQTLTSLDLQVLAKRYKTTVRSNQQSYVGGGIQTAGGVEDMIAYEKIFQDYERFEQKGLRAGFDPLKERHDNTVKTTMSQPKQMSAEVQKIYSDMSTYAVKMKIVDQLCEAFARKDQSNRGCLGYQQILEVFKSFKITLNTKQMNLILDPLPVDTLDTSYNYLVMIELFFTKQKAQEIQLRFRLSGLGGNQPNQGSQQTQRITLEMSQRLKDAIEVKLSHLQNLVHQVSKGSYLLKEVEFTKVFKQVGIVLTSQDHELLQQAYATLRNIQSHSIDFRSFIRRFDISDSSAQIIAALQREIATHNIRLVASEEEGGSVSALFLSQKETVTLEDFQRFLATQKIEIPGYTPQEINHCFDQMAERKDKMEKTQLIRILRNERDVGVNQQEWLPFIVNEFLYFITNNSLNIFKFVNPAAKKLTVSQFQTLMFEKLGYKPSNSKDLPTLYSFFALPSEPGKQQSELQISIEKILESLRKLDPSYATVQANIPETQVSNPQKQSTGPSQSQGEPQIGAKKLSQFSLRVKDILVKINDQVKRNGLSSKQVFEKVDFNKNGVVEKPEFVNFFTKDFLVKGLSLPEDIEVLFDALDMNKDSIISINEFYLCLDGVQQTIEQKIRAFDPDLEKSLVDEINILFDSFDTNKDGNISVDELQSALRSTNPLITAAEIAEIMKQSDTDRNQSIDRKEFQAIMLPQMKLEFISYEKNLDDLRRLFKEFDLDQSNYLDKDELRAALMKLNIILSDVQLEDLMQQIDLDNNQVIDIDEFIAFLSIADQIQFKNPHTKSIIVKIKHSRKLQAADFYNCFKSLPQFFQLSITQQHLEKKYMHTPSWGLYPEFDSKTMAYKDLQKMEEIAKVNQKKFIEMYQPQLGCEVMLEEATGVPMPKKEDYDWGRITNREIRMVLIDFKTQDLLSNTYIVSANWKADLPGKWLFNASETHAFCKGFVMRTDLFNRAQGEQQQSRDIHLLFELILYTKNENETQQMCCSWGTIPINQMDKHAKHKVVLRGGSPLSEMKINKTDIFQEKKGFEFLKLITASSDEPQLILNVKPFAKLPEQQQFYLSMLPSSCLVNRKLLSFIAAFRLLTFRRLAKAQQQLHAPSGNFAIAQFRKIFDNPDVNLILADCWDANESTALKSTTLDQMMNKVEDSLLKAYAIIYSEAFHFDHVYPTRSNPVDSETFLARDALLKQQLAPSKYKKALAVSQQVNKENTNNSNDDYKPFNISEMEMTMCGIDFIEAKQDELTKMYTQMGLMM